MTDARLLHRRLAAARGPPRARAGARARVPRGAARARRPRLRLGGVLAGVPPAGVPRVADDGRPGDDRRAHRARRRDVPDDARPLRPAGARPGRARAAARARDRQARRRCGPSPARRAATRRGPRSSGTRAGTSTPSPTTASPALYTRLGLYPNLGVSWITAFLCGPDRATVAVIDFAAPLPQARARSTSPATGCRSSTSASRAARALPRAPAGRRARRTPDAAALLRGERGEPRAGRLRPRVGDGRRALRLPRHDALRDPLPGQRHA